MNETVLILDDSLTVRMDLAEAFDAAQFRTLPCATAAEARELLAHEAIDVIILDVLLPDADGVEFLAELRSTPASAGVVVLMLSTEAEVRDRVRALKTGADEYVGKPYDTRYVVAKAQELHRARARTAGESTTILIIDDSVTFREELRRACREAGYEVLTAETGAEGLRLAATQRPNAIIVDGILPGDDGGSVIRRLRLDVALRSTPCLLLTGTQGPQAELVALDAGADAFVRKEEDTTVVLARLAALLRSATSATTEDTRSLSGPKKILAVDDSPTYLNELSQLLRDEGYDVAMARSGEEALELVAVQVVDCILLDLLMPGISGEETCRRIKSVPVVREIPIIMLTSLEDREAMINALGAGADDYIQKSSEFEVLSARVRAQIRRKQFEDENRNIRDQLLQKEIEATESRAAAELSETRAVLVAELERKNRELEAFSYSVSHDLRAPLRGIDGFSQALLEDYKDKLDATGVDYLGRVRAAAQRMGELIDDLLDLSRVGRTELHRDHVDLSAIAEAITTSLAQRDPDRHVVVEISNGPEALADSRLMMAALENLFENAWKFTSRVAEPKIEFGSYDQDGVTVYFLRDNGSGFDMKYVERLFKPFQRLHGAEDFPGTGIGLATVHRIIERHGGEVRAQGTVGGGATISFTLSSAFPPGDSVRGGLILLVEDRDDDVELTLRAFSKSNVANEIVVVRDGEEALDYLFTSGSYADRDPCLTPSLVLLDLKLPKVSGLEVLRRMRADTRTRRLPVVVLTSSNEERDVIASYDLGANSFVRKPVDFTQFIEAAHHLGLYWLALNEPFQ
jgi:DNA-binding response OmpR family regulator